MKHSLIIDGQILQTDAWYRGMGKYLLQVLDELSRNHSAKIQVAILVNDRLKCDKARFETLHYLYPNIELVHCDLPLPDKTQHRAARQYKKRLNLCVDSLFPGTEKFYLLTSLFLFDFFAEFPDDCHKLVLFYDLTPLLFWRDLGGYFPQNLYMERFKRLYEAERIFAISQTTRQDLLEVFGLNPGQVTNINGGFIKIADKPAKPKGFTIPPEFILFPTGDLPHKNNTLTVRAFNQYCEGRKNTVKLLITSHFNEKSKQHLLSLSKHIIFTDNVSDDELEWLYENAEAIIFSSKYEGLGMPILDAVANKKPIIASKIPVFEEMSKSAFYFFDPENSDDLEPQIEQALSKHNFGDKLKHYSQIMDTYTWSKTTNKISFYVLNAVHINPNDINRGKQRSKEKPRIAVCSLHPGIKGQIGQLSEQLYLNLKNNFQVDYYFDSNGLNFRDLDRPTFLDLIGCKVFDITKLDLRTYAKYESVVYIIDKFAIPSRLVQRSIVLPGIIISGTFSGLDQQGELMKQLVLDNPSYNYVYNANGFKEYQSIISYILSKIIQQRRHLSPSMSILRNGGSKRTILRKLRAVYENDN